ncbi:hypothetical protein GGS23DRAFT_601519 [Durotheca rogersii]|uniref:uncharacterized protein n=1 Tax=Durotheca rogersii TaxID=419775 RepID=UPI00221ED1F6|nr:uncharacterized protein GGS23DRAFT_601519 [Durotheca rogersii]KAI5855039.1 hypothetical protein GGS23DRAFT_601519 [Durotheca rogersii]
MGASNFGANATGEGLRETPNNGTFKQVELFYQNVYYFSKATDDEIEAFPVGLQMVGGNASLRVLLLRLAN